MEKKLQRNEQDKMLAGVCAGLADYFDVDVTWVRIAFVIATLAGASGFLAYIILWIAVPVKPFNYKTGGYNADYRVYEDKSFTANPVTDPNQPDFKAAVRTRRKNNGRVVVGLFMIVFGAFFLLDEFDFIPYWFDFGKLWPLVFIIPGLLMIAKAGKKEAYKQDIQEEPHLGTKPEDTAATDTTSTSTQPSTDQTI
jgi:phage shock protein C